MSQSNSKLLRSELGTAILTFMGIIYGFILLILIVLLLVLPYLLIDLTKDLNSIIGVAITWVVFGMGYYYGKYQQRAHDKHKKAMRDQQRELDDHDRARGIGKYAQPG